MECLSFYCVDSGGNNRSTDELRRHQPHQRQRQRQRQQVNRQKNEMDPRKKMSFSSASIEFIYMAASPPCRAVWMCIKELGIEVDMRHIDMYKKAEHTQPWFVKVRKNLWHWHSHAETRRDTKGKREVGILFRFLFETIWFFVVLVVVRFDSYLNWRLFTVCSLDSDWASNLFSAIVHVDYVKIG